MQGLGFLVWIGVALSWYGIIRYIIGIWKEGTKPRLATWIAWAASNSVLMTVALANDATTAAVFNGLAALGNICVLSVSIVKKSNGRLSHPTDWMCFAGAGVCLAIILVSQHTYILNAALAMCANTLITWPTIRDTWHKPHEYTWQLFAANGGANTLGFISVIGTAGNTMANAGGPLVSMIGNGILVSLTVGRRWLKRTIRDVETEAQELKEAFTEPLSLESLALEGPALQPIHTPPRKPRLIDVVK